MVCIVLMACDYFLRLLHVSLSSKGTTSMAMLVLQIPVLAEKDMTNDSELYIT